MKYLAQFFKGEELIEELQTSDNNEAFWLEIYPQATQVTFTPAVEINHYLYAKLTHTKPYYMSQVDEGDKSFFVQYVGKLEHELLEKLIHISNTFGYRLSISQANYLTVKFTPKN